MILVDLLNLTFESEFAAGGTQMSNSLHEIPSRIPRFARLPGRSCNEIATQGRKLPASLSKQLNTYIYFKLCNP